LSRRLQSSVAFELEYAIIVSAYLQAVRNFACTRLSGIELLEAYESMVMIPRDDMVRRCGYVTIDQDGTEVIHYAAFYDALALADSQILQ